MVAYAEFFDELFRGIFGPRHPKPRLRKDSGLWECSSPELSTFAPTPLEAFTLWRECMDLGRGQLP